MKLVWLVSANPSCVCIQILRKREDKENDPAREAKRSKMRSRRVSFAPDDELETMHLYQKVRGCWLTMQQHAKAAGCLIAFHS